MGLIISSLKNLLLILIFDDQSKIQKTVCNNDQTKVTETNLKESRSYKPTTEKARELSENEKALRRLCRITNLHPNDINNVLHVSALTSDKNVHYDIRYYFYNGQCHSFHLQLKNIIKIKRFEDNEKYSDSTTSNKVLLWHGTKSKNISSILKYGFSRPHKPRRKLMFGNGVYFADRASKSAQYCGTTTTEKGSRGYLILCSVNLGRSYKTNFADNNHRNNPPPGFDSVIGKGKFIPDNRQKSLYRGSTILYGETVPRYKGEGLKLNYNEYIVYDTKRIVVKFLVEFETT